MSTFHTKGGEAVDVQDYIPMSEAVAIIGVHRSYIAKLCANGKLAGAAKVGRNWLIPRASAEEYRRRKEERESGG